MMEMILITSLQMIQVTLRISIQILVWIHVFHRRIFIHLDNLGKCGLLRFPEGQRLEEI